MIFLAFNYLPVGAVKNIIGDDEGSKSQIKIFNLFSNCGTSAIIIPQSGLVMPSPTGHCVSWRQQHAADLLLFIQIFRCE